MTYLLWDVLLYILFPVLLASLTGFAFWRKRRVLLGNAIGSGIIAAVMIGFILARFGEFMANPVPSQAPVMTMLVLAGLGWLDVFILFFISGFVEDRVQRKTPMRPDDF